MSASENKSAPIKLVIVVNGSGGVGKDTLCNFVGEKYASESVSSIDPIKKLAAECGWDGGKDDKSRRFLAELKRVCAEYNDLPTKYLMGKYEEFMSGSLNILFVHIREKEEIEKFKALVGVGCATLLVRRTDAETNWNNAADGNVEDYSYDYYYNNDLPLDEAKADFIKFMEKILSDYSDYSV